MKVKTATGIIDPENEPILLVFRNDADRLSVARHLLNMPPVEGRARVYAIFPDNHPVEDIERLAADAIDAEDPFLKQPIDKL